MGFYRDIADVYNESDVVIYAEVKDRQGRFVGMIDKNKNSSVNKQLYSRRVNMALFHPPGPMPSAFIMPGTLIPGS